MNTGVELGNKQDSLSPAAFLSFHHTPKEIMAADFTAELNGIDKAIQALTNLKALLQGGAPPFNGFHDNPIDGSCLIRSSDQQTLDDGGYCSVRIYENPSKDLSVRANHVHVNWDTP